MDERKMYLFVVDTTENQFANVGRGILNTQLILAKDKQEAKELFIKIYKPNILQQIQYFTYIYDLDDIKSHLTEIDATKFTPIFSHLPLQGGRPPKPEALISEAVVQNLVKNTPVQQVAPSRSVPHPMPQPVNNKWTKEQIDLIKMHGAIPTPGGENAGFNPRINASTGMENRNINTNQLQTQDSVQKMTPDQIAYLKSAGVDLSALQLNIEVTPDDSNRGRAMEQQSELTVINEAPLTDAQIEALKNQIQ